MYTPVSDCHLFTIAPGAYVPHLSVEVWEEIARTASDEAKEPSGCRRVMAAPLPPRLPCRLAGRGSFFSFGVLLWWQMVVAFYLSCLLAPRQEVAQVGKHGPYHDDDICTIGAHSFNVAIRLGTCSMLNAHYLGERSCRSTAATRYLGT